MKAAHPEATPIAGGTDLMVEINLDHGRPTAIIDLTRIAELTEWGTEDGHLRIGATGGGVMVWAVFTDSIAPPGPCFLAGDYFGATGQVTVAAGLGANVLIGGSNTTIALQPVSVATSVGLNLALGVAELHLRPGP